MPFAGTNYWSQDTYLFIGKIFEYKLFYLLIAVAYHFLTCVVTVCITCARVKQTEEIINFGNGTYCGTWAFTGGFLLYGNYGGKAFNFINIGAFQTAEKLACISRKSFNISALPFGINGIKRQRGFSAAGKPCDYY